MEQAENGGGKTPMKRVLVALLGGTPQILTEALHALHEEGNFPYRVVLLTTGLGRSVFARRLVGEGHLARLLESLGTSPDIGAGGLVAEKDVLVPRDADGRELEDIVTARDSEAFFELCFSVVRELAEDEETELLFSIAGGRKTMSAALALAAQCYARGRDRMFHVLVPAECEKNPDFFFPEGQWSAARVLLTPVPFFRMRQTLPDEFMQGTPSFSAVSSLCELSAQSRLRLSFATCTLVLGEKSLRLSPALFAVYAFFVLQNVEAGRKSAVGPGAYGCGASSMDSAASASLEPVAALSWQDIEALRPRIADIYARVHGSGLCRGNQGIANLSPENFRSYVSRIRTELCRVFGRETGLKAAIVSRRVGGVAVYKLPLPASRLEIEGHLW